MDEIYGFLNDKKIIITAYYELCYKEFAYSLILFAILLVMALLPVIRFFYYLPVIFLTLFTAVFVIDGSINIYKSCKLASDKFKEYGVDYKPESIYKKILVISVISITIILTTLGISLYLGVR